MLVYATSGDLTGWVATTPTNAAELIRFASGLVRRATVCAIYDVDVDGAPTEAAIVTAFRDAVCAQVAVWAALGASPVKGAADAGKTVASKSIGSATVQYATSPATITAKARASTSLCDEAVMILADADLTSLSPVTLR